MDIINCARPIAAGAGMIVLGVFVSACASPKPAPAPPPPQQLWGDLKPVVSVKEFMRDVIDPMSDNIFDSVKEERTKRGTIVTEPKTDEDWNKIRSGAVGLAEAIALLKVPRPFAPPGDLNNSTGPNAVELAPAQITAKVERDRVEWNARIEALRNVGLEVMDIVKRKDTQEMWDAAENLDNACEACHQSYWYPGENAEFYQRLRHNLDEFNKRAAPSNGSPKLPPKPTPGSRK
jgi:hypothetical protein